MKLKNIAYSVLGAAALMVGTTSCADYLDVSSEFNESQKTTDTWTNPTYTRNWYGVIYRNLCEFSETGSEGGSGFKNPWAVICGEIASRNNPARDVMTAGFTASEGFHRWATYYKDIRQAMMFLEYGTDSGVGDPTSSNYISADEMARMKDDCRFMLAYYYFQIFELYGPGCIVTELDDPAEPSKNDYERATVDEYVAYIDGLLAPLCNPQTSHLPESVIVSHTTDGSYSFNTREIVRPTVVLARALRAKLWIYAASKLFNGGNGSQYYEGLKSLKNSQGEPLFPQSKDQHKWEIARDRVKDLIDFAEAQGHALFRSITNGIESPDRSVYELFQIYNQEILWCSTSNSYSDQYKMEKRTNPRDVNSCYPTIGPTQDAVDMFFMANGLAINDPGSGYDETGFTSVENKCYDPDFKAKKTDNNIFNMYAGREPRFYAAVAYQGRSWFKKWMDSHSNYTLDFSPGGGNDLSSNNNPHTGYILNKFKNRAVDHGSGNMNAWFRVSIIYRLAEFYLFYAEALNEINPSDPQIIEYIDRVRERAGIPGYRQMEANGTKTGVIGNYKKQFDAILHERYAELFCEGQHYFDVRRWMVAGDKDRIGCDQTRFYGMNMTGSKTDVPGSSTSYYTRTQLEKRQWNDKLYLYPIHQNVIELSNGLVVQNYGW